MYVTLYFFVYFTECIMFKVPTSPPSSPSVDDDGHKLLISIARRQPQAVGAVLLPCLSGERDALARPLFRQAGNDRSFQLSVKTRT